MSFSYYDKDNNIKKIDIKVGMNWAELKTDNEKLNSIFGQIDDGDGVVQFTEKMLLEDVVAQVDDLGGEVSGNDKVLQNEEIEGFETKDSLLQLKFNKNYFSLESLKQAFPENEFTFEYEDEEMTNGDIIDKKTGQRFFHFDYYKENNTFSITEFTKTGNLYDIRNKRDETQLEIQNFNDKNKNYSFMFLGETMVSAINEQKSEYFYGQDEIQSKMYYNQFNNQDWIKNEAIEFFNNIDDKNLNDFISEYHFYNPYLGILEQIANCEEIPQKTRDEFISKTLQRLEKENGYEKELTIKNSQIENSFYKSQNSYNINFSNDIVTITNNNNNSEQTVLDLKKLLKDIPIDMQPKIKAELQKLPAEVLIDLSIECDKFNKPVKHQRGEVGLYNSSIDRIALGLGKISDITAYTIAHEIGHAIDNREADTIYSRDDFEYKLIQKGKQKGNTRNTKIMASKHNKKFKNAYEVAKYKAMGLDRYMNINPDTYEISFNKEKLEENGYLKNDKWTSKYYTKEKNLERQCYMFSTLTEAPSELYCIAMLGEASNDNSIYITPELMEEFLKDLEKVRSYTQEQRHTREE